MAHKTTVTLPDDLYRSWKRTGEHLTDIIRRGVEGSGDSARHTRAEERLAAIEHRLALLEARVATTEHVTADLAAFSGEDEAAELDAPSAEERDQHRDHVREQSARRWHFTLASYGPADPLAPHVVTSTEAAHAWKVAVSTARDRLAVLVGYQLATAEGADDTNTHRWTITRPPVEQAPANVNGSTRGADPASSVTYADLPPDTLEA